MVVGTYYRGRVFGLLLALAWPGCSYVPPWRAWPGVALRQVSHRTRTRSPGQVQPVRVGKHERGGLA